MPAHRIAFAAARYWHNTETRENRHAPPLIKPMAHAFLALVCPRSWEMADFARCGFLDGGNALKFFVVHFCSY